jgi:hypothetical protein
MKICAMPEPMPITSVSEGAPFSRRAVSVRLSTSPTTRSASYRNVRPASVSSIPRGVRRNSAKPISCSSRCTCSLTADCEMLRRLAAPVKLRSLATDSA